MRLPFIKRESDAERQAKIAAREARLAAKAKAWKRFWLTLALVMGAGFLGVLMIVGLLVGSLIYLGRNLPRVGQTESQSLPRAVTAVPSPTPSQHFTPPSRSSSASKGFVESEAEKEYERKHGVEIVHMKNGKTYKRKAPNKQK